MVAICTGKLEGISMKNSEFLVGTLRTYLFLYSGDELAVLSESVIGD